MGKISLSILLVDDRDDFRQSFASWLRDSLGHTVEEAKSFNEALLIFGSRRCDLAIVDYSLDPSGQGDGLELLHELKKLDPEFPVIVITGYGNRPIAKRALRAGALWYLDKPPDLVEIEVLLDQASKSRDRSSQQVLSAISEALVTAPDVGSLVSAICQISADYLHASSCNILIINPETNNPQHLPESWTLAPSSKVNYLLELVQRTIAEGRPEIVQNFDLHIEVDSPLSAKAYATCPCPPRPRPSVVIVACFTSPLGPSEVLEFNRSAEELSQIIGATLTNIYSLQLNEEIRALGLSLLRAGSADEVYAEIAKTVIKNFDLSGFSLCLYESTTRQISFPIAFERGEALAVEPLPLTESIDTNYQYLSEYVIRNGEPLELPDQQSLDSFAVRPLHVGNVVTKSYFAVPVRLDAAQPAFGALSIQSESEGRFPNSAQRMLKEIASLSAPTLARLRKVKLGEEVLNHILRNNPRDVIKEIAQALKELVFADIVTFYPYDAERACFRRPSIEIGHRVRVDGESAWVSEEQTLGQLLSLHEHFAPSVHDDKTFTGDWINQLETVSSCGVLLHASAERQVQGALLLHFRSSRAFTNEERSEIRRFSERAALALYIAEIIEEQQATDRRSKAESDVIDAANTQDRLELACLLEQTAPKVWPQGRVKLQVLLYNRPTDSYQHLNGSPAEVKVDIDPFLHVGIQGPGSANEDVSSLASPAGTTGQRALLVPIRVGDSRLGTLLCEAEEPILAARDKIFLERLAKTLAGTLIAAAREQRVELIKEVDAKAAADPSHALGTVTELTHRIATGAGGAPTSTTIFLLTGTMLEPVSAFPPDRLMEVRQRIGYLSIDPAREKRRGVVARAAVLKQTQLILDIHADDDYIALDPLTQAELAVPVFGFDREIVGVLNLEFQNPLSLNRDDCSLVETLAEQTTVVNVLQTQALTLTKTEKIKTLSAALAILGINATESGHRLKGLLGSLRKEVDVCESYLKGVHFGYKGLFAHLFQWNLHPQRVINSLEKLAQALQRLRAGLMTTDLEGSTESIMERSNLLVSSWISGIGDFWREHELGTQPSVDIEVDDQTRSSDAIYVNEHWLTQGVYTLISNAVRAVRKLPEPPRIVTLRTRCSEDSILRIEVHDNGPGIPAAVSSHLFSAQIPKDLVDTGGHGTGCLLSSFIAQLYDGRVFLLPDGERGAHVAMEIPLSKTLNHLIFSSKRK